MPQDSLTLKLPAALIKKQGRNNKVLTAGARDLKDLTNWCTFNFWIKTKPKPPNKQQQQDKNMIYIYFLPSPTLVWLWFLTAGLLTVGICAKSFTEGGNLFICMTKPFSLLLYNFLKFYHYHHHCLAPYPILPCRPGWFGTPVATRGSPE